MQRLSVPRHLRRRSGTFTVLRRVRNHAVLISTTSILEFPSAHLFQEYQWRIHHYGKPKMPQILSLAVRNLQMPELTLVEIATHIISLRQLQLSLEYSVSVHDYFRQAYCNYSCGDFLVSRLAGAIRSTNYHQIWYVEGDKDPLRYAKVYIDWSIFGDLWPPKPPKIPNFANLFAPYRRIPQSLFMTFTSYMHL